MDLLNVMAGALEMCGPSGELTMVFEFLGKLLNVVKIVVPIILIAMGSIDLTKAVMASKDDEIKKAQTTLIKRAIVAVIIFFIPSIVQLLISMVNPDFSKDENCLQCVLDVKKCR